MPSRPLSLTADATAASDAPSACSASLRTMGRLTPDTTSTLASSRNIEAMSVGAPPNISVIKSTPRPCETRAIARSNSCRATSTSSCQSIDAEVMCVSGWPRIISAAARNSLARCACETSTPPTSGASFFGLASITFMATAAILPLSSRASLLHIAMHCARLKAGASQSTGQLIRDHH